MAKSKQTSAATPETTDAAKQSALAERVEQERLTRRQALRKFGFGAGLSAFMLLGVDDLARMVGREMERRAGDNKVAEQIANEFQGMGVAFASPSGSGDPCQDCYNHYICQIKNCDCFVAMSPSITPCEQSAYDSYKTCTDAHCSGAGPDKTTPVNCNPCPPVYYA